MLIIAQAGCQSPYQKFFQSAVAEPHPPLSKYPEHNLMAHQGDPEVRHQRLDREDIRSMRAEGYVLLGQSSFNATSQSSAGAKQQADRLGAKLVVVAQQKTGTRTAAMPVTTPTSSTSYHSGTISGSYGTSSYSGTSTTYGTQTTYMPYSVERYDHLATYWTTRLAPLVLGIHCRNLTPKERQKFQTNDGVFVSTAVRGTPAWEADLLPGDIIVRFADQKIDSMQKLWTAVEDRAGQTVSIALMRDGRRQTTKVKLNPDPLANTNDPTERSNASQHGG
jgi:hypothetical protein